MKQTVGFNDFCDAFRRIDREKQFSREGLKALFDYLEEYEKASGEDVELDVIALCCEYSEDDYATVAAENGVQLDDDSDESDVRQSVLNYLDEHTTVVHRGEDTVLFACF